MMLIFLDVRGTGGEHILCTTLFSPKEGFILAQQKE
jgi:hypothetical protein